MSVKAEVEKIKDSKTILILWTGPEIETGGVPFLTAVMKYMTKPTYGRKSYSVSRWQIKVISSVRQPHTLHPPSGSRE